MSWLQSFLPEKTRILLKNFTHFRGGNLRMYFLDNLRLFNQKQVIESFWANFAKAQKNGKDQNISSKL